MDTWRPRDSRQRPLVDVTIRHCYTHTVPNTGGYQRKQISMTQGTHFKTGDDVRADLRRRTPDEQRRRNAEAIAQRET